MEESDRNRVSTEFRSMTSRSLITWKQELNREEVLTTKQEEDSGGIYEVNKSKKGLFSELAELPQKQ